MSNTTPRAKPAARPSSPRGERAPASPRASPAAAKPNGDKEKKPKVKKVKGDKLPPTAPMTLEMPMHKVTELNETQAKDDLQELQKKYGALIVNFNNQQAELAKALKERAELEARVVDLESERGQPPPSAEEAIQRLQKQLESAQGEVNALEQNNMNLQKKVNKLQVEHVSEEEVDQLFYALEQKEKQLAKVMEEKKGMEEEILTARQLTARGGNVEPKYIEVHHHNDISDESEPDES